MLGTRTGSAHLAAAERAGVVFPPWGPTRFDGPHVKHVRATVDDIAQRLGATAHQVAQAWHLHRSPNALPIPRTRTIRHFDAKHRRRADRLTAEEVGRPTDLTHENNGETNS